MSGTGATSAINLDLNKDGVIDTRINLLAFSESGRHGKGGKLNTAPRFSLSLSTVNPTSRRQDINGQWQNSYRPSIS